ncbi:MAG: VanZ family protein [Gemmatimonadales bacterium]
MTTGRTRTALLGGMMAGLGTVAILGLTLFPDPEQAPYSALTPLFCVVCGTHGGADVFLNLLLFAPLGAGLRLAGWRWPRVVGVSALLSLTVEFLQYSVVTGRDASLSDLLTNTAGAAIAAALAPQVGALLAPHGVLASRLCLAATGLWLATLGASAAGMEPWLPPGTIRSDCTRSSGKVEVFAGTARSVVLNGVPLPCDADTPDAARLRHQLGRGEAVLEVATPSGDPARGRVAMHAVRMPETYALLLEQEGRAATFRTPVAGNRLGFYSPILRLPGAFPAEAGVPVQLQAGVREQRMWLASDYSGRRQVTEVRLSPSHGWTGLFPTGIRAGRRFRIATALWVGLLILPAGYWAGFVRRPAWALAGILAALGAGLGLLPFLTGYSPVHWSEWLGGVAGIAGGWALHRFAAYLQTRCGSPSTSAYSSP